MPEALLAREPAIRLTGFVAVLALMALWETLAPRRRPGEARARHVARNLAVATIDAAVVRLCVPMLPVALAALAVERGWGLFGHLVWPAWLEVVLAMLLFDFAIYCQHRLFHAVPWMWRLHKVHHSDLDYDATTGVRFHPLEILLSLAIKSALVVAVGPAPVAVLAFETILNATALFNHGNVRLPARLDRVLRWLVVTPDMHRVHHSAVVRETNSNYGFNLPWWDRWLGTYRAQPAAGHDTMQLGLDEFRQRRQTTLGKLLRMPFGDSRVAGGDKSTP